MEAIGTSGSSDALTIALRQERQKAKAQRGHHAVEPGAARHRHSGKKKSRSKVIKDGVEKARRNKSAMLDANQDRHGASFAMQSTPTKRTNSRKEEISPGGTMTTGSEMSEEDKPEDSSKGKVARNRSPRATQGVGFMKTFFRKTKPSRVPSTVETTSPAAPSATLRDPDVQSIDTPTVRHRNTKKPKSLPGDSDDPAILIKRARRYKKKAKRLLEQATAMGGEKGHAKKDARVVEALARKSYRYAAESRRLSELIRLKLDSVASEVESHDSESDASIVQNQERRQPNSKKKSSENEAYSPPVWDEDDTIQTIHTSFSEKVERDEHRRKWKEFELFGATDLFGPMACGRGVELGQQYAHEAKIIVHSLRDVRSMSGDNMSVMSPDTVKSDETTASEAALRREHNQKMKELELFSASNMMESWNVWVQSFWTRKATTPATQFDDDDDANRSLDGDSRQGEARRIGGLCGPTMLEDDVLNDDDMIIERRRYNHFMEDEDSSSDADGHTSSSDEDDSGSGSGECEVDSDDESEDGKSGSESSDESDDESKRSRRGVFGLIFDKY